MNRTTLVATAAIAVAVGAYAASMAIGPGQQAAPTAAAPREGGPMVSVALPETLSGQARLGKRAFDAVCASCHGANAAGRAGIAPPLVHRIYEPSHHGDIAFQMAAANGVRAHHWRFGDMPPQPQVTPGDVKAIVAYVRALQRANGID